MTRTDEHAFTNAEKPLAYAWFFCLGILTGVSVALVVFG